MLREPVGSYLNELQILRQVRKKTELCDKVAEPCNSIKLGAEVLLSGSVVPMKGLSFTHN